MGSVLLGRTTGAAGFSRLVAVKRLHPHHAQDPGFISRFKDEVRVSGSVQHPNVVQTLDVLSASGGLLLVMEYIDGATLHALLEDAAKQGRSLPLDVVSQVMVSCLHGIHAAHEATDDDGAPLRIVHRDVSPQNIMIGRDGQIKVLDFGLAQAAAQSHVSRVGLASGKAGYMAPEQIRCEELDRRTDIFALGVVLWEALTGQRLFRPGKVNDAVAIRNVLAMPIPPPSSHRPEVPAAVDELTLRALDRDPLARFANARDFALALEAALPPATASRVGNCLEELCGPRLEEREQLLASVRRGVVLTADTAVTPRDIGELKTEAALPGLATDALGASAPKSADRSSKALAVSILALAGVLGLFVHARTPSMPVTKIEQAVGPRAGLSGVATANASATLVAPVPPATNPPAALSAQATALAPSRVEGPRDRPATSRVKARNSKVSSSAALCTPPTFVDAEGIRHFKEGCI
jgi:eukaryotic-like serine/threonine-protein kinase